MLWLQTSTIGYYNTSFSGSACLAGMQQVESAQSLEGGKAELSQAAVVNEETSAVGGYTKYYYAGSDLVAFNRSSGYGEAYGLRYVFGDHLGSTSLVINGGGKVLWAERSFGFAQDKLQTLRRLPLHLEQVGGWQRSHQSPDRLSLYRPAPGKRDQTVRLHLPLV